MASTSSKALPFISLAIGFVMAILAAMGYGQQLESVVSFLGLVLPITAGGGLINKALDASVEKSKTFQTDALRNVVRSVMDEIKATKPAESIEIKKTQ